VTGFARDSHELVCDGVPLSTIVEAVGTPVYVYSAPLVRDRYRAIDAAFDGYPHRLHYALKANSTLALARVLSELGSGADANSIWEIELARRAGFAPADLVFTGVGKAPQELACAVPMGLKAINVESAGELSRVEAIAARLGLTVRVALRVNPDVDARSHPHISTGLRINKFGIPLDEARDLAGGLRTRGHLRLVAVHVHVGSQMTSLEPLAAAARVAADLARDLGRDGVRLEYVDLGGGLGISYDGGDVPSDAAYARALVDAVAPLGLPIVVEPGRAIVAPAGILVAQVIDAGMTELLRPALYGAFHRIEPLRPSASAARQYEFVGPVCESSDVVGRDRRVPALAVGDFVAIRDAGAYGAAMASNYNRRPLPAEVLVDEGAWRVVRRRQTIADMTALETE
jgi:diaminopimelate decarboxylase